MRSGFFCRGLAVAKKGADYSVWLEEIELGMHPRYLAPRDPSRGFFLVIIICYDKCGDRPACGHPFGESPGGPPAGASPFARLHLREKLSAFVTCKSDERRTGIIQTSTVGRIVPIGQ